MEPSGGDRGARRVHGPDGGRRDRRLLHSAAADHQPHPRPGPCYWCAHGLAQRAGDAARRAAQEPARGGRADGEAARPARRAHAARHGARARPAHERPRRRSRRRPRRRPRRARHGQLAPRRAPQGRIPFRKADGRSAARTRRLGHALPLLLEAAALHLQARRRRRQTAAAPGALLAAPVEARAQHGQPARTAGAARPQAGRVGVLPLLLLLVAPLECG